MNPSNQPGYPKVNRRASRRLHGRGHVRFECRKGAFGLGPNVAVLLLDLSEMGACLVVKSKWEKGQEVEVSLSGGFGEPIKRLATVIWTHPTDKNCHVTGVHFQRPLRYGDLQRLAAPDVKPNPSRVPSATA
jgi:hypothetical protein